MRLLADTALTVTDIAFASGFESLRRFNVAFHERYGMSPSALRRSEREKRRLGASGVGSLARDHQTGGSSSRPDVAAS